MRSSGSARAAPCYKAAVRRLIELPYSPWSEKARWALDHHKLPYERVTYTPLLGEVGLRLQTRNFTSRASVPTLIDEDGEVYADSLLIAQHADHIGQGSRLFPRHLMSDIERWSTEGEWGLAAGRGLVLAAVRTDDEAQRELVPSAIPGPLRGVAQPLALLGVAFLSWKYGLDETATPTVLTERLQKMLAALRRQLGNKHYVLGEFSYADIAMAAALHFLSPPSDEWMHLGPGTRRTFTRPELAERYRDLLGWRDKLYAERRTGPRA